MTTTKITQSSSSNLIKTDTLQKPIDVSNVPVSSELNYQIDEEATISLMKGINLVNDTVKRTLGPRGKNALLGAREWPYTISTNDGASIASRVKSENRYEQMGIRLIQEAIDRANKESGDGSTTTCVLTAGLLKEGVGSNIDNIGSWLNSYVPKLVEEVKKRSKNIELKDARRIAIISAQDGEMGNLIGEIYESIGKNGIIDWDTSKTDKTYFVVKEGIELKYVGFEHRSFVNANDKGFVNDPFQGDRIVISEPNILMTKEKVSTGTQLEPYISYLIRNGIHEMVLFCNEIEPMVLAQIELMGLGVNLPGQKPKEAFRIYVLKAPTMWKDWVYEDLAKMTGAIVLNTGSAATFKTNTANPDFFGHCEKMIVKKDNTYVIGTNDISEHIKTLEEQVRDHQEYEKRIEWLNSKTAVVHLAFHSELELSYKRLKLEDARAAAKLALKDGVVAGGGVILKEIAETLGDTPVEKIIKQALLYPMKQIEENGVRDVEKSVLVNKIEDPTSIIINAIKASFSVAAQVLDAVTIIPID